MGAAQPRLVPVRVSICQYRWASYSSPALCWALRKGTPLHLSRALILLKHSYLSPCSSEHHFESLEGQGDLGQLSNRPGVPQPFQSGAGVGAGLLGSGALVPSTQTSALQPLPPFSVGRRGHLKAHPLACPSTRMGFGEEIASGGRGPASISLGLAGHLVPELLPQ